MTERERAHVEKLIFEALRFSLWAAGQGLFPANGEPAEAPEDFLFNYSTAMDIDDWDGLPTAIVEMIRTSGEYGEKK